MGVFLCVRLVLVVGQLCSPTGSAGKLALDILGVNQVQALGQAGVTRTFALASAGVVGSSEHGEEIAFLVEKEVFTSGMVD